MTRPEDTGPDDTEIAAEYVLRVLKPDAHRTAAIRAASDPAFAAEVRAWEDRLAPMMAEVDPVEPDPSVKAALMRRLFGVDDLQPTGTRVGIWQLLAGLGFATAAALAVMTFQAQAPAPDAGTEVAVEATTGRFVAELAVADETTRMFAVIDVASGELDLAWTARNQPEGREFQLWAIAEGQNPVSIGVLPPGRQATLEMPVGLAVSDGLTLAISDEPPGGSPTGLPTGEVLATAAVSAI